MKPINRRATAVLALFCSTFYVAAPMAYASSSVSTSVASSDPSVDTSTDSGSDVTADDGSDLLDTVIDTPSADASASDATATDPAASTDASTKAPSFFDKAGDFLTNLNKILQPLLAIIGEINDATHLFDGLFGGLFGGANGAMNGGAGTGANGGVGSNTGRNTPTTVPSTPGAGHTGTPVVSTPTSTNGGFLASHSVRPIPHITGGTTNTTHVAHSLGMKRNSKGAGWYREPSKK